jgi:hypothetical protein
MYKKLLIIGAILASLAIALFFGASKAEAAGYPVYQSPNFASLYPYPTYEQYQNWYNATHQTQYPTIGGGSYPVYPTYTYTAPYPQYPAYQSPNFSNLYSSYPTYEQYQNWYNSNFPQQYPTFSNYYGYNSYSGYNNYYGYNQNPWNNFLTCVASQIICAYGQSYCSCGGYPYSY